MIRKRRDTRRMGAKENGDMRRKVCGREPTVHRVHLELEIHHAAVVMGALLRMVDETTAKLPRGLNPPAEAYQYMHDLQTTARDIGAALEVIADDLIRQGGEQ